METSVTWFSRQNQIAITIASSIRTSPDSSANGEPMAKVNLVCEFGSVLPGIEGRLSVDGSGRCTHGANDSWRCSRHSSVAAATGGNRRVLEKDARQFCRTIATSNDQPAAMPVALEQQHPSLVPLALDSKHNAPQTSGADLLPADLDPSTLPQHVAIIMDGNSRWAKSRGLSREAGHEAGVRALKEVVRLSCLWGVHALTVFAFSTENWLRPKVEVKFLMRLFELVLREQVPLMLRENICIRFVGDTSLLPRSLQELIHETHLLSHKSSGLKLNIALSYSGRQDLVQACRNLAEKVSDGELRPSDITESVFEEELATSWMGDLSNPDLLIRTSGEQRMSNFLLWQSAYSELYFSEVCWPDFDERHFRDALVSFQHRERRFGKRK